MSFNFVLPIIQPLSGDSLNFLVDWGDSSGTQIFQVDRNNWSTTNFSHTYNSDAEQTIKIYPSIGHSFGKYWGWLSAGSPSAAMVQKIKSWGGFEFGYYGKSFYGCGNMNIMDGAGAPSLPYADSLHMAFKFCSSLAPNISTDSDFSNWNTTSATNLTETFRGCALFNGHINKWNVANVTNTTRTFLDCTSFNNPLSNWNTQNLVTAFQMFQGATSFNQSLAGWNVSKLNNIGYMFYGATDFSSQIFSNFGDSITSVPVLLGAFRECKFNGSNITTWDVSLVTDFKTLFQDNTVFNQDIGNWDTGSALNFSNMFDGATSFNQDISDWDTQNVEDFSNMFNEATSFNQDINTGSSISKHGTTYNPWTIKSSSVNMDNMLDGASSFDQDISDWNMSGVTSATDLLDNTGLSAENSNLINDSSTGWPSQSGVSSAVTNESSSAESNSGTVAASISGLQTTSLEHDSITASWTALSGSGRTYSVQLLSSTGTVLQGTSNHSTNTITYNDTTVPNGGINEETTYTVRVKANPLFSAGESTAGPWTTIPATTPPAAIPAPTGDLVLSVDNSITGTGHGNTVDGPAGHHQVWYKGTYAPGADQLIIQASTSSDFTGSLLTLQASSANAEFSDWTVFSHVAMQAETEYYFRYKGKTNSGIESDWSTAVGPLKTDVESPPTGASYYFEVESFEANQDTAGNWGAGTGNSMILSTAAVHSPSDYWIPIRVKLKSSYAWSNHPYVKWEVLVKETGATDYSLQAPPNALANTAPSGGTWQIYDVTDEVNGVAGGGSRASGGTGYPSNAPAGGTAASTSSPICLSGSPSVQNGTWTIVGSHNGHPTWSSGSTPARYLYAKSNTASPQWRIAHDFTTTTAYLDSSATVTSPELSGWGQGVIITAGACGSATPAADLYLKPETQYSIKARMVWKDRPWESDEWIGAWVSGTTHMYAGIHARHIVGEDNEPFAAKEITITTPPARSAPDVTNVQTSTVYSWSAAPIGSYSNGLPMGDNASFDDWRGDKKITFSFNRPGANGVRSFLWQLAVDPNFENLVAECGASEYWAGNHYFNDYDYSYQPGSNKGARLFLPTRNVGSIDVAKCYDLANGFLDGDWVTVDEGTTFELDWALQPATTYYFRIRCLPLDIHWDNALAASLGATYPDAAGWSLETNPGSWGQGNPYGQYDDAGLPYARATTGTPAAISYASVHEGPMVGGGTADTIFLYVKGFAMQNGTTITVQHYVGGNWNTVESWNTVIGHWHSGKTEIITGVGNGAGNNTDVNEAGETIGYPAVQRVRYGPRGGPIEWNSEPSEDGYHVSRHYQFEGSSFSISAGDTMKIKVEHAGLILEEKEITVN